MTRKLNVSKGDRFGRLVVLDEVSSDTGRKFNLLCDCGNETCVFLGNLRRGHTVSCGCLADEVAGNNSRTHGMTNTSVYKSWQNMKDRCYRLANKHYNEYGGRGITVCESWVNSFQSFICDVGLPPDNDKRWSIERIDVDGNYEPDNVKWALPDTQNRNRRKFKNNKSGETGVARRERNGQIRYVAFWRELDSTERSKSFSVKTYGEAAYTLAVEFRKAQISRLILEGGDYSEKHGAA